MERKFPLLCPFLLKPFTRISKNPIPWQFHQSFQASYWYSVKLEEDSYKCVNGLKRLMPQIFKVQSNLSLRVTNIWRVEYISVKIKSNQSVFEDSHQNKWRRYTNNRRQHKVVWQERQEVGWCQKQSNLSFFISQNRRLNKRRERLSFFIGPN